MRSNLQNGETSQALSRLQSIQESTGLINVAEFQQIIQTLDKVTRFVNIILNPLANLCFLEKITRLHPQGKGGPLRSAVS